MPACYRPEDLAAAMQPLTGTLIRHASDTADPTLALLAGWELAAVGHNPVATPRGRTDVTLTLRDGTGLEYHLAFPAADVWRLKVVLGAPPSLSLAFISGRAIHLGLAVLAIWVPGGLYPRPGSRAIAKLAHLEVNP